MVRFTTMTTTILAWTFLAMAATASTTSGSSSEFADVFDFSCTESSGVLPFFNSKSSVSWAGSFLSPFDFAATKDFVCSSPLGFGITPFPDSRQVPMGAGAALVPVPPMLVSESSMETLKEYWSNTEEANAISFEFWITPAADQYQDESAPIFTIGTTTPLVDNSHSEFHKDCQGFDFRLSQLAGSSSSLELHFSDDDTVRGGTRCRRIPIAIPDSDDLTQVAVVLAHKKLNIYVNGETVYGNIPIQFQGTMDRWNPAYNMQLFSNFLEPFSDYELPPFFQGSIHRLSILDYALNDAQVEDLYTAGLLEIPSMPKITTTTAATASPRSSGGSSLEILIPSLNATPNATFWLPQDTTSAVPMHLQGTTSINITALSATGARLQVEILSVPKQGLLQDAQNTTIQVGDRLDMESIVVVATSDDSSSTDAEEAMEISTVAASIRYTLQSTDYFSTPQASITGQDLQQEPEVLEYRLVAVSMYSEEVMSSSDTVIQPIHVVHVNHPSTLVASADVTTLTMVDTWDEGFDHGRYPAGRLQGKIVLEQDALDVDMQLVRVDVSANNGVVTLNEQYRDLALFPDSCTGRGGYGFDSSWQCVGSGIRDRVVRFLAVPSDVELILSDMLFEAFAFARSGDITIQVYDGAGGNCMTEEEHLMYWTSAVTSQQQSSSPFATIYRDQCYESVVVIEVEALDGDATKDDNKYNWPDMLRHALIGLLLCAVICFVLCCRCLRRNLFVGGNTATGAAAAKEAIGDEESGTTETASKEGAGDEETGNA